MFGDSILLSFIVDPVTYPSHQVVGVFEFAQLVSHVQEQVACDRCFQCQDLVHPLCIGAFVVNIVAYAYIDREDRHDQFAPYG